MRIVRPKAENRSLVLTFDELLRRTPLARRMSKMLQILEKHYQARRWIPNSPCGWSIPTALIPEVEISLLQCRPQSHLQESEARLPQDLTG